jgi:branched-chain amino acid transport system ATP-binding protein
MSQPYLSVRGLQAGYGHAQVLFDVSFEVVPGEVITLLGRNGMGRSTTVKCLFGILQPNGGQIKVGGLPTVGWPSYRIARHGLALVPEGRQIFSELTVAENLIATARAAHPLNAGSQWTLERVYGLFPRLKERRDHLGRQLSGGEQQMLAIGRALMTNPHLLVLDEATEGLAPIIREEIWKTLAALKREGLAQIVIDKNVGALLRLADRHYVIEKGRIVWEGSSDSIYAQPDVIHRFIGM